MGTTREERAEWIASMLRDECNCLGGRLDHDNCLRMLHWKVTGAELLNLIDNDLEAGE